MVQTVFTYGEWGEEGAGKVFFHFRSLYIFIQQTYFFQNINFTLSLLFKK